MYLLAVLWHLPVPRVLSVLLLLTCPRWNAGMQPRLVGRNPAHLLLDAGIQPPQGLLEVLVLWLKGGTALHVLKSLVQLLQVLQCLASPIQSLNV